MFAINNLYKKQLVDALLDCDSMSDTEIRNSIIDDLPSNIKHRIKIHSTSLTTVNNLVSRCSDFQTGIELLIQLVSANETSSEPMKKVYDAIPNYMGFDSCISNNRLSELLRILAKTIPDEKEWLSIYRKCLPSNYKPLNESFSLWIILRQLANIPLQSKKFLPILLFIRQIADITEDQKITDQLVTWLDKAKAEIEEETDLSIEIESPQEIHGENNHAYLLVHLRPDPNNKSNKLQKFTVHFYKWKNQKNCRRIYDNPGCEKQKILEVIDSVIDSPEFSEEEKIRNIEFILPYEWIHLDVDKWKRKDDFETRLVDDYRLLIRLDRYYDNLGGIRHRRFRDHWREKWTYFMEIRSRMENPDSYIQWVCGNNTFQKKQVYDEYQKNQNKTCLAMTFLPKQSEEVGNLILFLGIPVALWCNKTGHKEEEHEIIKKAIGCILEDGDFNCLADRIHKICRLPEHEKSLEHHLTLFWDNPDRIPLEFGKRNDLKH